MEKYPQKIGGSDLCWAIGICSIQQLEGEWKFLLILKEISIQLLKKKTQTLSNWMRKSNGGIAPTLKGARILNSFTM